MIIANGPDGLELLPTPHAALRLTHVLSAAELDAANQILRQHGVAEFAAPCQVAMLVERVRWLDGAWRAHVLGELEAALGGTDEANRVSDSASGVEQDDTRMPT